MAGYVPWLGVEIEIKEKLTGLMGQMININEEFLWRLSGKVRDRASDNAPVDTGALKTAISITTTRRSDHTSRIAKAKMLRPEARFADVSQPPENAADVHAAAHYATFQELGTRFHPAHPFLIPAAMMAAQIAGTIFSQVVAEYVPNLLERYYKLQS